MLLQILEKARQQVMAKTGGKYPAPFKILDAIEVGTAPLCFVGQLVVRLLLSCSFAVMGCHDRRECLYSGLDKGLEAGLRREAINFGELTQTRESKGTSAA